METQEKNKSCAEKPFQWKLAQEKNNQHMHLVRKETEIRFHVCLYKIKLYKNYYIYIYIYIDACLMYIYNW